MRWDSTRSLAKDVLWEPQKPWRVGGEVYRAIREHNAYLLLDIESEESRRKLEKASAGLAGVSAAAVETLSHAITGIGAFGATYGIISQEALDNPEAALICGGVAVLARPTMYGYGKLLHLWNRGAKRIDAFFGIQRGRGTTPSA